MLHQQHPYPSIPPHPICFCPYCNSTPMYAPYVVSHHPNIPSLGYLHRPPSILPSYMFQNLLPPDAPPHFSRRKSEHRRIMSNQRSNLLKNRRKYARRRRVKVADLESHSGHASLRQSELGGFVAPKYQDLVDMS